MYCKSDLFWFFKPGKENMVEPVNKEEIV